MPGLDLVSLTRKIRIEIEGQIHAATVEVMMDLLRKTLSPLAAALQVGKTFEAQFTKTLFDADGLSTSLGFKVIDALRFRANYEATNMSETENARRQNAANLRNNASTLERLFSADLASSSGS